MYSQNKCHICFLPESEKDSVNLIRYKNSVYKFAVKNNKEFQKILQDYKDVIIQKELENVIAHALNSDQRDKDESTIYTPFFGIRINILSKLIENIHYRKKNYAKQQFVITFIMKSVDKKTQLLIQTEEERLDNLFNANTSISETAKDQLCYKAKGQENGLLVRFFRCLFRL
ncbi:hypothetical protein JTE90_015253 [Oedothorax gibbosus]|uniref:Uncharacterized protein n=1 Tax=Oedothorax gibbosus TaxID=931172 RepID=A0AAV6TZP3_9ARAC|nr:hypothetical protein JTE90_015253 [Oedothorax gibbosus]